MLAQSDSNRAKAQKWFSLPKESYMEKKGDGCGKMRLTPSNEKLGNGDPA